MNEQEQVLINLYEKAAQDKAERTAQIQQQRYSHWIAQEIEYLHQAMDRLIGDAAIKYEIVTPDHCHTNGCAECRPYITLAGITRGRVYYTRDHALELHPVLNEPDGAWRDNPANTNLPQTGRIEDLAEIGAILAQWQSAKWELEPELVSDFTPNSTPPTYFDIVNLRQMNTLKHQGRTFEIRGLVSSPDEYTAQVLIEFTDM